MPMASHEKEIAVKAKAVPALLILLILLTLRISGLGWAETVQPAPPGLVSAEASRDVLALESGKPIERVLAPGEVHSYRLDLRAGEAVSILFERQGVALVGTVSDPAGGKIGRFGSNAARVGREPVDFTATVPGTYRIDVRTYLPADPPGRYKVTIAKQVAASPGGGGSPAASKCVERPWRDHLNNFDVDSALASIAGCMETVSRKLGPDFPTAADLVADARAEADFLIGRWHWGEVVSPAYEESLILDFKMLAIAAKEPDRKKAHEILREVVDDLKIKAEHCRNSTHGLGQDVTVLVRTKKGNQEDPGWIVYYMPRIYEFADRHDPERFPKESSPTEHALPAGRYLMWGGHSGQPATPQAQKHTVKVGEGKTSREWDLSVP
jgi:hypothetical protein